MQGDNDPSCVGNLAAGPMAASGGQQGPFWSGFLQNLRSGLKVAAFQPVTAADFSADGWQLAALFITEMSLAFILRLAVAGTHGFLDPYEIPGATFHLPFLLFTAFLCARLERSDALVLVIPVALLGALLPLELVDAWLKLGDTSGWLKLPPVLLSPEYYFPFFGWWAVAGALAIARLCATTRQRLPLAAALILFLFLPLSLFPRGEPWIATRNPDTGPAQHTVTDEEVFYAQPAILERQLALLKPGRKGLANLYFVGMAGYAEEDVFGHEIEVISRLFSERFGTAGRSVALVNNPRTLLDSPIASRTSLARTLDRIGSIMNREEDILFLYLTSHGSETHELELSFEPLELAPLDPENLRKILDASGIRWRVVVISACYSGGFIDKLKDDRTLVITASDADHNSFGCGSESDFTYFGKAYFDEALRKETSFIAAFDRAKETINRRELAEGETPSNPQIAAGKAIERQLRRLEAGRQERKD